MYQGKFEQKNRPSGRQMPPLKHGKQLVPLSAPAIAKPQKKGPLRGSAIFYLCFFSYILVFYLALYGGLTFLKDWLTNFELAQPTRKSREVFSQFFESRDWNALYDAAQVQGESRESFTAYLESTVGSQSLTCMETSAGLSGDRKYNVRLGNRKLASFTLTDNNHVTTLTGLPDWQLSGMEFFFDRQDSWLVQVPSGCTVWADGRKLDDSSILRIRSTKADLYLPKDVTGPRILTMEIPGTVSRPNVDVLDAAGMPLSVTFDEAARTFTAGEEPPALSGEERKLALDAVKTYALYMIERAGAAEVAEYFEKDTSTYTAIISTDRSAVQDAQSREFTDESVTDYCRYSDGSFSVRVELTLKQYRPSGSAKEDRISQSLFFRKTNGKWKCWQMTAIDVSAVTETVRLTFRDQKGILSDGFYPADLSLLVCPTVTAPEGMIFSGWVVEETDAAGQTVKRLVFQPDADGTVSLPGGTQLEPMTLYPLFE